MRLIRRLSSSRRVNHNSKRSASYEFRDLTDTGIGNLFEGKVIYDKTYGHVAYGCASCCGYYPPVVLTYDPFGIPLSDTFLNGVSAYDYCADMMSIVDGNFYYNWGTGDTSIATVDGYGTHTGVGVGSTSSGTSGTLTSQGGRSCPLRPQAPRGTANVVAVPTNFHQTYVADAGGGDLHFQYSWDSTSGNLTDLSNCTVGEIVGYPGPNNPYTWPSPPFPPNASQSPTVIDLPATDGALVDDHKLSPSTTFAQPYSQSTFTAIQYYRYKCTNANNGQYVDLVSALSIQRTVDQNPDASWFFTVTKSGASATINPLP
jgi:hypothetical protein